VRVMDGMYGWRGWLAKSTLLLAVAGAVAVPALGGGAASASPSLPAAPVVTASTVGTATTTLRSAVATLPGSLVAVRAGRHACFDRLVLEFRGRAPGYTVRYVRQVLTEGQGKPIPLAGRAALAVVVRGSSTYAPRDPAHVVDVRGFQALRQVAWGGSFEGYTTLGVGVRTRLPIHVFVLPGPGRDSRLVIDMAHHR
jgi:hypothetical protein